VVEGRPNISQMQTFNITTSYAIISAIRSGLKSNLSEDEKLVYDVDIAESYLNQPMGMIY